MPRCSTGRSGWTASGRELRVPAARLQAARLDEDVLAAVRELARAVAEFCGPQRPPDMEVEAVRGRAGGAALAPARLGRDLRARRPRGVSVVARHGGCAGARRGRAPDRGRDAAAGRSDAGGRARARNRRRSMPSAARRRSPRWRTAPRRSRPVDKIVGPGNRWVTAAKLLVSSRVAIDLPAGPSEVVVIADSSADPAQCAADLLAQAEHGPDSSAVLLSLSPALSEAVGSVVDGNGNVSVEDMASLDEALARSEAFAPEHLELWIEDAEPAAATRPQRRHGVRPHVGSRRRLRRRRDARAPDRRSRARCRRPRARELPQARPDRPRERRRACGERADRRPARPRGRPAAARGRAGGCSERPSAARGVRGVRVVAELGRGRGPPRAATGAGAPLRPEHAPGAGRAAGAARARASPGSTSTPTGRIASFARPPPATAASTAEQIVVGAGADDLIAVCARTYLGPGRTAAISPPTYALYGLASQIEGAEVVREPDGASVIWICNPNNPTGELREQARDRRRSHARTPARRSSSTRPTSSTAARRAVPLIAEHPNVIVLRTLSKAFGLASLRVGYAVASTPTAAELELRRAPANVSGPVGDDRGRRTARSPARRRGDDRRAGARAGGARGRRLRLPAERRRTSSSSAATSSLGERLEEQGLVVRIFPEGIRDHAPPRRTRTTCCWPRSARRPAPAPARSAFVSRLTTETAVRLSLDLDGRRRACASRRAIGFLDHLLTLVRLSRRLRSRARAPAATSRSTSITRSRTSSQRSATRWPERSASGTASPATARDRPDGRGARDGRGRPRAPAARRDRAALRRRPGRRARAHAAAARARAARDGGRLHAARRVVRRPTTTTSPRRPSRRSDARSREACAAGDAGVRSTKGLA